MSDYHQHPEDGKLAMLEKHSAQLSEHFDSIIILATGPTEDGTGATTMFKSQRGNVHAHEGAVREWLREQEAYQTAYFAVKGTKHGKRDLDE